MTPEQFAAWGWRVPFLLSFLLLAISVYIRLKLEESPIFAEMKAQGKGSKAPLTESFARWDNGKVVLKALFGITAGQGVVWYAGQFYALYFLTTTLKVDYVTTYIMIGIALLLGAAMGVGFAALSDKVGRKKILMTGLILAAFGYQPIFKQLTQAANPALAEAMGRSPVVLQTTEFRGTLALTFDALADAAKKIVLPSKPRTETDKARNYLNSHGIPFRLAPMQEGGGEVTLQVAASTVRGFNEKAYDEAIAPAGYPKKADPDEINFALIIALLTVSSCSSAWSTGRSRPTSRSSSRRASDTPRCRFRTTSATDGSAASCR